MNNKYPNDVNQMANMGIISALCPQCNTYHPKLEEGQKCPIAKVVTNEGKSYDFNNFLSSIKNILHSKIEQKKINNVDKLFSNIILEINDYIDNRYIDE